MNVFTSSAFQSHTVNNSRTRFENALIEQKNTPSSIELKSFSFDNRLSLVGKFSDPILIVKTGAISNNVSEGEAVLNPRWSAVYIDPPGFNIKIRKTYSLESNVGDGGRVHNASSRVHGAGDRVHGAGGWRQGGVKTRKLNLAAGYYKSVKSVCRRLTQICKNAGARVRFVMEDGKVVIRISRGRKRLYNHTVSLSNTLADRLGFITSRWRENEISRGERVGFIHFNTKHHRLMVSKSAPRMQQVVFKGFTPNTDSLFVDGDVKNIFVQGIESLGARDHMKVSTVGGGMLKIVISEDTINHPSPDMMFNLKLLDYCNIYTLKDSADETLPRGKWERDSFKSIILKGGRVESFRQVHTGESILIHFDYTRRIPQFIKLYCEQIKSDAGIGTHSKHLLQVVPYTTKNYYKWEEVNAPALDIREGGLTGLTFRVTDENDIQLNLVPGSPTAIHILLHQNRGRSMVSRIGYFDSMDKESLQFYPSNINSDFVQSLPESADFSKDQYLISLNSIYIPGRMSNVLSGYTRFQVIQDDASFTMRVKSGYYSESEFVSKMGDLLSTHRIEVLYNGDVVKMRNNSTRSLDVCINPQMAYMIGCCNTINTVNTIITLVPGEWFKFVRPIDVSILRTRMLKIFCSITEESLLGTCRERILRIIDLAGHTGVGGEFHNFAVQQWVKVRRGVYSEVRFEVKDENNTPIEFDVDGNERIRGVFTVQKI